MKKFNYKSRKGFTLIELLVVIGILAVLAAIAIPSVAGLIDRANVSADDTNANEMTNALERFTSEYELFCQDIASGKLNINDLDAAQSRVYNVTGAENRDDIKDLESVGLDGKRINRDTKYPANLTTAKSIVENYTKTSSATYEPKQSDMNFYYSPDCGVVVFSEATDEPNVEELNKLIISGKDAKGKEVSSSTKWINLTNGTESTVEVMSNYTDEEIANNPLLEGIGATKRNYVVAEFNSDYTSVTIKMNTSDSDGKMMNWNEEIDGTLSPFYDKAETTLTTVIIEEGIKNIGDEAFWACQEINSISFPQSLIEIGKYGFSTMTYYTDKLVLPNNLQIIGDYAFESCNFSSIIIPSSVKTIGDYAFQFCDKLTELTIPDSVTALGEGFAHICKNLEKVSIGKNVEKIPKNAFVSCEKLTTVNFPKNLKSIGAQAFENCLRLKTIVIPSSVTTIEELAFYTNNTRINDFTIYLPKSITQIGGFAFYGSGGRYRTYTIYCETQDVANLINAGSEVYNQDTTTLQVDATKF